MKKLIFGLLLVCGIASACEDLSISKVSDQGKIVILNDGSVWQVDFSDTVTSTLWMMYDDVTACDDILINTSQGEKVSAKKVN